MTEMKQHAALAAANEFIKKDPVFFADFADMLRLCRYRLCYAAEDGILMQDTSGYYKDGTYLFAAKDEIAAEKILLACPEEHENMRNGTVSCHGEKSPRRYALFSVMIVSPRVIRWCMLRKNRCR